MIPTWTDLVLLVVQGPELGAWPRVRGSVLDGGKVLQVWSDGRSLRVDRSDGSRWLLSDGERHWLFRGTTARPASAPDAYLGDAGILLTGPSVTWFDGEDRFRPDGEVRAVTAHGRTAWRVPAVSQRTGPVTFTVDAASGRLWALERAGTGSWFVDVVLDEEFPAETFAWEGPATPEPEEEDPQTRLRAWFADQVGPSELRVTGLVRLDLTVTRVLQHDPSTGDFRASLATGRVSRRPRSERRPRRVLSRGHAWSTPGFDWRVEDLPFDLTDAGRQAVESAFPAD